jgi:tellurite resistance protein TerC
VFRTIKQVKRVVVTVLGFTVLLIGVAMLVLPGPAFVIIPVGLGILATEFIWARRLANKIKGMLRINRKAGDADETK